MLKQKSLQMNNKHTKRIIYLKSNQRAGSEQQCDGIMVLCGGLYSGSGSSEDFQVASKEPDHWCAWGSKTDRP